MRQYQEVKSKNPGALLFFRLGDFYELFYEDARLASPVLEVVLTQRQGVPMCGVPHHALSGYLAKLLKNGYSVAIAEQMEDPASTKGMVRRDVVRVVTPGTVLEDDLLQAKNNNFLLAAAPVSADQWGLAAVDMSTGEFLVTVISGDPKGKRLSDEIARLDPREILYTERFPLPRGFSQTMTSLEEHMFHPETAVKHLTRLFQVSSLAGFGLDKDHAALPSIGALFYYIEKNQPEALQAIKPPHQYHLDDYLALDDLAIRHLELLPSNKTKISSLLQVLDHTCTPMGGRKLKWWLLHPLRHVTLIHKRQDRVEFFVDKHMERSSMGKLLNEVADVERILARLSAGSATGRDLNSLRRTLRCLPELRRIFSDKPFLPDNDHPLASLLDALMMPHELMHLLETALTDDPPFRLSDGGVIRDGYSAELDELRKLAKHGRSWISDLEAGERQKTGINSLKIGFTSVFGYYLEVSRANLSKVPQEWIRKQTLTNAERFITPELKAQEDKILGAEEKSRALEAHLFVHVRQQVLQYKNELHNLAESLSELDALSSLSEVADKGNYVRPHVHDGDGIQFQKARHPVVEMALSESNMSQTPFVPNDTLLDSADNQILLVTGPNMGGKSTYLRQTALLTIMAHMGSFVPAEAAEVGIVDRVFTRIGAGDNLAAGASTFLVEMQEVSNILHNATGRSLVVLDEVGRGTSTYDGVAVAWAVIEYLCGPKKKNARLPKVLFATHYFELTELSDRFERIKNFHAAVREWTLPSGKTELVFLHQILPGSADRSYGVHVAQMAGVPEACVKRAKTILASLEKTGKKAPETVGTVQEQPQQQLDLFMSHPVLHELSHLEPNNVTPMEALQLINRFHKELNNH